VPEQIEQVRHRPVADVAARIAPAPGLSVIDHGRRSFIDQGRPEAPARHGLRGMLTRVGIRVEPSDAERAEREDRRAVAQHWPSRRTIAIVNGKGGAGKTPTTVCLSAIFARYGGGGVAAWDNNQTRGTLGWRTEKGPHDATLLELRDRAKDLRSTQAEAAEIAQFVHHQPDDKYDVLRSQPMILRDELRLGVRDFDSIARVLGKYYRLIFIDSGNDESDPLWGRMIDHADQIVVATTTRSDIAEAGALLLEGLTQRDEHAAALARNAVVVVSQANELGHVVRETVTIPFDRGMVEGLLQLDNLRPETRRAWLAAGAAVARGL
jgi:MinD-like ATPase involved in chromosome partitioning or flagellar assembly